MTIFQLITVAWFVFAAICSGLAVYLFASRIQQRPKPQPRRSFVHHTRHYRR